jgi:hypothetical protein
MRLDALRRPIGACLTLGTLALVSACGGGGNTTPTPSPRASASSSSTSSDTPSGSSSASSGGTGGITIGKQVFSSTLQPPTKDIPTGTNVTQDQNGLTLQVVNANGGYTYAGLKDFHGIPQDIAIRVHVAEAAPASGVYYGIACRGFGQNEQYLLLSDASGKWVITRVKGGKETLLKQGTATGVDATAGVTVDVACVTPKSNDKMNRVVLALNGKVVGSVDDSFENIAISNTFELFATSPDSSTGTGGVIFNRLIVYSASAQ